MFTELKLSGSTRQAAEETIFEPPNAPFALKDGALTAASQEEAS